MIHYGGKDGKEQPQQPAKPDKQRLALTALAALMGLDREDLDDLFLVIKAMNGSRAAAREVAKRVRAAFPTTEAVPWPTEIREHPTASADDLPALFIDDEPGDGQEDT